MVLKAFCCCPVLDTHTHTHIHLHTDENWRQTVLYRLTSCVEHSKHLLSPVGTGVWTYLQTGQLVTTHIHAQHTWLRTTQHWHFIANLWCSTQCHDVTTMQYKCVLHGCIACMYSWASHTFTATAENSPLCNRQHVIRQANPRFAGCIIRIVEKHSLCH